MTRRELFKLDIESLRDLALERDLDISESDTKEDLLYFLTGPGLEQLLDPIKSVMIEYLSAPEIIKLCRTSKNFEGICKDEGTWKFLLERDFGVTDSTNSRLEYEAILKIKEWYNLVSESGDPENLQEAYLAMFDLAAWNLIDQNNFPDLDIDITIPDKNNKGYMFLRRVISLYASLEDDFYKVEYYPFYKSLQKMYGKMIEKYEKSAKFYRIDSIIDLMTARGSEFIKKALKDKKVGEKMMKNINGKFIPFSISSMIDQIADTRDGLTIHGARINFIEILENFRKNPINDPILKNLEFEI